MDYTEQGRGPGSGSEEVQITEQMTEQTEHEPTIEEIVVALRDLTGRNPGEEAAFVEKAPPAPKAKEPGPDASPRQLERIEMHGAIASGDHRITAGSMSIANENAADLRDLEMQRLMDENYRLNQRVIYLLKIIGQQERAAHSSNGAIDGAASSSTPMLRSVGHDVIAAEIRRAIDAEMRPLLSTLSRVLEQALPEGGAAPAKQGGRFAPDPNPYLSAAEFVALCAEGERDRHQIRKVKTAATGGPKLSDHEADQVNTLPRAAAKSTQAQSQAPTMAMNGAAHRAAPPEVITNPDQDFKWILDVIQSAGTRPQAPCMQNRDADRPAEAIVAPESNRRVSLIERVLRRQGSRSKPLIAH